MFVLLRMLATPGTRFVAPGRSDGRGGLPMLVATAVARPPILDTPFARPSALGMPVTPPLLASPAAAAAAVGKLVNRPASRLWIAANCEAKRSERGDEGPRRLVVSTLRRLKMIPITA